MANLCLGGRGLQGRGTSMKKYAVYLLIAVIAVFCLASGTYGQAESGLINGTVTDQSGAVVPKAKIVARNVGTNAERLTETDGNGFYSFSNLPPGLYAVTAESTNFAKTTVRAEVTVGARVNLNLQLSVAASVTTVVEVVSEGGEQVNTESQTIGNIIDSQQLQELPSLTR